MNSNIREKPLLPTFLKKNYFLRTLFYETAQGIFPYIFVPKEIYYNLKSSKPDLYNLSLIKHEQTHIDRQKKQGWFLWMIKYLFNSRFRFTEEMIANKNQMKYMKKNKLKFPFEKKAKMLSSWVYFWPVTYNEALKELKTAWEKV